MACHTAEKGGAHGVGPNLHSIVGGQIAARQGFGYTEAMAGMEGIWSPERLDAYLADPQGVVPGTSMVLPGILSAAERAAIISYLNSLSDGPLELDPTDPSESTGGHAYGVLHDAPGVATTFYACTACHSEMIVAQQGFSRSGWEKTLELMYEEHGMSELGEAEREEVLDYLAAHYGVDRPNFPRKGGN